MRKKVDQENLLIAKGLYYEGMFFKQISEIVNISISSLQQHSHIQQWKRKPGYVKPIFISEKKKERIHQKTKQELMKEKPPVNEKSMLDSCIRAMWVITHDSVY